MIFFDVLALLIVWLIHWRMTKFTKLIEYQLLSLTKKQSKFMTHLTRELKIPMPEFDEKPPPPRETNKPRVVKKTENDEFEKELPANRSGQRLV